MKSIIVAFVLILTVSITLGQGALSLDEHHKYIYYQVINLPGNKADTLNARGIRFLKADPKTAITAAANALNGRIRFSTFTSLTGPRHETGEMVCTVNLEIKDDKYRYWLTDFVFTPYKRDRYSNFVPETGINILLEEGPSRLGKKDAEILISQTGSFCTQFARLLQSAMLKQFTPPKVAEAKKVVAETW